jgi:hypothetical protein
MAWDNCFIEFEVSDKQRFQDLVRAFNALKTDKDSRNFRDPEDWLEFFDDHALSHFLWPEELNDGLSDEELTAIYEEKWPFESMLLVIKDCEYALVSCKLISETRARLEYAPWAFPYGEIDSLIPLVECFGFDIVMIDDGSGPKSYSRGDL